MSNMPFVHDIYFLQLLVNHTNKKQINKLIKLISSKQKSDLHHIAKNILKEKIKIGKSDLTKISKFKTLVRKLGKNKQFSPLYLNKNIKGLITLVKVFLNNETHSKNSSNSSRKMGTNQRPKKRGTPRYSDSDSSSEWESITSNSETGERSSETTSECEQSESRNEVNEETPKNEKEEEENQDEEFNF